MAKCGNLVAWHWAHVAADCDPWAEPESAWHLGWKSYLEQQGGRPEVAMGPHRADVVMPSGRVVELQSAYLSSTSVADREQFYGNMMWIYRCTWADRLHWGRRGFWWKNGSRAMLTHRAPVWWHVDDRLVRVRLSGVKTEDGGCRVVGQVWQQMPAPAINFVPA